MTDIPEDAKPPPVPAAPALREVDSPPVEDVLDGVPSVEAIIEGARPAEKIIDDQPSREQLVREEAPPVEPPPAAE